MMRHKGRKIRWPIAASLLTHSLLIGIALGSAAFGTRMMNPNVIPVSIVSEESSDKSPGETQKHSSVSSTAVPSQTHLIPRNRKVQRQIRVFKPSVEEEASQSLVAAKTEEIKQKISEEGTAHNTQLPDVLATETDQQSMENAYDDSTQLSDRPPDPPERQTEEQGQTLTGGLGGAKTDSMYSESGRGKSQDAMAEFISQVRQVIEQNKQYPSLARLQGVEGTTQLRFRILPTGEPTEIKVVQSSQSTVLDEAAVATVKRSGKFPRPPVTSNRGILIRLPLVFHLEGG